MGSMSLVELQPRQRGKFQNGRLITKKQKCAPGAKAVEECLRNMACHNNDSQSLIASIRFSASVLPTV